MAAWLRLLVWGLACWAGGVAAQPAVETAAAPAQVLVLLRLPPAHYRPDGPYAGGYGDGAGRVARQALVRELAAAHGLRAAGDWVLPSLGLDCHVLDVPAAQAVDAVVERLSQDRRVVWAQPMHVYRAQQGPPATHDDPLYAAQPAAQAWRLADLHTLATGRGVRVAVIDSGVDTAHPDLAGRIEIAHDLVDGRTGVPAEAHGTAVAGIVAAASDNRLGVAGVAPQARLLALRACWQTDPDHTLCNTLSLARALQAALIARAGVVNLSLSGPPDRLLAALLDRLLQQGSTVVVAHDAGAPAGGFPASHPGVLGVADAAPAPWLAPGRDVPVLRPGGGFGVVSGASYAAAHVSGLVALLRELGAGSPTLLSSGGRIDACASVLRAAKPRGGDCADARVARP